MGYRTVVLLNNDRQGDWEGSGLSGSPSLGAKISLDQHRGGRLSSMDGCGQVIECVHTSQDSLLFVQHLIGVDLMDSREFNAGVLRNSKQMHEAALRALQQAAEQFGMKLIKKPQKRK